MALEYYKVQRYVKEGRRITKARNKFVCPHNDACVCSVKACINCGWNPNVAKARMEKICKGRRQAHG